MAPISRAAFRWWWLVAWLNAGCTAYHETSLHRIEAHPDSFIDKKVRVHVAGGADTTVVSGLTAQQSSEMRLAVDPTVFLWVAEVRYPVLAGRTFSEPGLYASVAPASPVQVDLTGSRKVEVYEFSPVRTLLVAAGIALVAVAVYQGMQAAGEEVFTDVFGGIFGGTTGGHHSAAATPSP